jgi:hypothetical protein
MTRHGLRPDLIWTEAATVLRRQERVPVGAFESFSGGHLLCVVGAMNWVLGGDADSGVNDRLDVLGPVADVILRDHPELAPDMFSVGRWLDPDEAFLIVTRWNDRHCDSGARAADLLERVAEGAKVPSPV